MGSLGESWTGREGVLDRQRSGAGWRDDGRGSLGQASFGGQSGGSLGQASFGGGAVLAVLGSSLESRTGSDRRGRRAARPPKGDHDSVPVSIRTRSQLSNESRLATPIGGSDYAEPGRRARSFDGCPRPTPGRRARSFDGCPRPTFDGCPRPTLRNSLTTVGLRLRSAGRTTPSRVAEPGRSMGAFDGCPRPSRSAAISSPTRARGTPRCRAGSRRGRARGRACGRTPSCRRSGRAPRARPSTSPRTT